VGALCGLVLCEPGHGSVEAMVTPVCARPGFAFRPFVGLSASGGVHPQCWVWGCVFPPIRPHIPPSGCACTCATSRNAAVLAVCMQQSCIWCTSSLVVRGHQVGDVMGYVRICDQATSAKRYLWPSTNYNIPQHLACKVFAAYQCGPICFVYSPNRFHL